MKTASVRELRQEFPRLLDWLRAGEKVTITLRQQPVATLVPRSPKRRPRRPMPDIGARLQKVFGRRVISDRAMRTLMDQNRGAF